MTQYQLTADPDQIRCTETGAMIPRGHRLWDEYEAWLAEGNTPDPVAGPSQAERDLAIRDGVYRWMDSICQGNDYDNITTCLTYLSSGVPKFKAEATAMLQLRDAVAQKLIALQSERPAGVETLQDVIALLPQPEQFGWVRDPRPGVGPTDDEPPVEIG